ncbi:MAG: helix-turn-helix domain-containing protein [Gammaproteobacteria bacterium]|nr:helix-turn-helix domain-containing protein [Gammaproteobacteria bacterium]
MRNSCRQLACGERCQIKVLMSRGDSIREIARYLGRSAATISREIARNQGLRPPAMLRAFPASC